MTEPSAPAAARARAPRLLWAAGVGLAVANLVLVLAAHGKGDGHAFGFPGGVAVAGLAFVTMGALIASRAPGNAVGWLGLWTGLWLIASNDMQAYGIYGVSVSPLPGDRVVGWLGSWTWLIGAAPGLTLLVTLFPDGRPPSPRWRALGWATVGAITLAAVGAAMRGWPPSELTARGMQGISEATGAAGAVFGVGLILVVAAILASVASLVGRYRRGTNEQRHQVKWLGYAVVLVACVLAAQSIGALTSGLEPGWAEPLVVVVMSLVPAAIAMAVFRYRLYEIDLVINRTVLYGLLAGFIGVVYVALVVGIGLALGTGGKPNTALSVAATAIVAVAFQPVRERARRLANRLAYGRRVTPFEALAGFAERVAETTATEETLPRLARVIAEGTGAARAEVWLRVGDVLLLSAAWPADDRDDEVPLEGERLPDLPGIDRAVPVLHRGELLGALTVAKRPGEAVTAEEERLLAGLASQAGLVLRNVRLTAELASSLEAISVQTSELRASARRIVVAQDDERRRWEANIHDGAQQHLVALAVQVGLAKGLASKDPERARALLAQLRALTHEALDTLRDLARGIFPTLLAEQGLVEAVRARAGTAPLPVEVEAGPVPRYAQEVEAAAYFSILEAIQNCAKHARASRVEVRIGGTDDELRFSVSDDGAGFDPRSIAAGAGLGNMSDRLDALGGSIEIDSSPGEGTTISGRVPARAMEAVG